MNTSPSSSTMRPDDIAAAIRDLLRGRRPGGAGPVIAGDAVLVPGRSPHSAATAVVAALDDDANPRRILPFSAIEAVRRGVPLRAVHVWTRHGRPPEGVRRCRHDRMTDADLLLSQVLYDYLPVDEADAAEREILYDDEPVRALVELSRTSALLVLAARGLGGAGQAVGSTVRGLVGRTHCPLIVLPPVDPIVAGDPSGAW
ncbi:universal stress protein [Actinoplanes sp. NPDC049316]|uniref:universal stress protein n=1 Tax=Actinoplanes sp. NPDC049316 TaxID=3154727 RepID=UPI00342B1A15